MSTDDTASKINPAPETPSSGVTDLSSSRVAPSPDAPVATHELRGRFAVALCKAHRIGADDGSTPCEEGLACSKKDACLDMADKTLGYAHDLSRGRTNA